MLAGATGIDFVLLVVAADDGPMPQTREHLAIVDLLGLRRGAVALTKIDTVSAGARGRGAGRKSPTLLAGTPLGTAPRLSRRGDHAATASAALREHLRAAAAALGERTRPAAASASPSTARSRCPASAPW